jgi:transitional endoplasmic reticulum ATPase
MSGQILELETQKLQTDTSTSLQATCLQADTLLWSLRALKLAHDRHMNMELDESQSRRGVSNRGILEALRDHVRPLCNGVAPPSLNAMVEQLPHIELRLASIKLPSCPSDRTIKAIVANCGLNPVEQELIRFKAGWGISEILSMVFKRYFANFTVRSFLEAISIILQIDLPALRVALNPDGFLSRARVMSLSEPSGHTFRNGIEDCLWVRPGLLQLLETADGDYGRLVRTMAWPSPEKGLSEQDFRYLDKEWSLALGYLRGSLKGGHKGANILLHGIPGVGKTEFARALIRAAGAVGFEIKSANLDHNLLCPDERRDRYFLAGELLPRDRKTVLVFDDADGSLGAEKINPAERNWSKAALNQMLENNPFPTIWLMNETNMLDAALLRRFDVSIPFRRPPASVIRRLLKKVLPSQSVSESWLQQVAAAPAVTPAIVKRFERITDRLESTDNVEQILNTSLELSRIKVNGTRVGAFNRQYCNAEPGIEAICGYLESSSSSRLMLHGPTGTGKTALARHLAESTDLCPRLVRPSEILGPYVGQTEHNIARLFEETDPSEQLIILDEFESLAEDRRGSHRSWEISKVAEFLSRFEEYKGRIIACTNLPDNVDTAVKRRFHLKARLGLLTPEQRMEVVRKFALELKCKLPKDDAGLADHLHGLAYGHVMNAFDVARYMGRMAWPQFIKLLESELTGTEGRARQRIGFVK